MSSLTRSAAAATACLALPLALTACGSSSKDAGSSAQSVSASSTAAPKSSASRASSSAGAAAAGTSSSSSSGSTGSTGSAAGQASSAGGSTSTARKSGADTAASAGYTKATAVATSSHKQAVANKPASGPAPSGRQAFSTKVSGKTLSYSYSTSGSQTMFQAADGTVMAYDKPARMTISFGDGGTDKGAEAGMACKPKSAVHPFKASSSARHLYNKTGTYKVTVRTDFCGSAGLTSTTSTYTVTIK